MFERYPKWLLSAREKTIILFSKYSLPRWLVFCFDSTAVILTFIFAYILRYNFITADFSYKMVFHQAVIATCVYAFFSLIFRSYSGLIRHTTLSDIFKVFVTTSCAAFLMVAITLTDRLIALNDNFNIPISIIVIHYTVLTLLLFFIRTTIKIFFKVITSSFSEKKRILIYGAGEMGFIIKRVLLSDIHGSYYISGFIDESKQLQGKNLNGIPVYNPKMLSAEFLQRNKIKSMILAVRNLTPGKKSELVQYSLDLGLELLEAPSIDKWLNNQLQIRQIKKVKLEDLLSRDPIQLNMALIGKGLNKKTIMVTGAAGSIGSEIVRQLSRFAVKKAILVDQAETPMFNLNNELKDKYSHLKYELVIADVTNHEKMDLIFQEFHPQIVFHAAAYKHVPLMEENPHEAVRVNIGGTRLIAALSVRYGIEKFVMISTDKSVNPTNVMGASKRVCEMVLQSIVKQAGVTTQFVITRFGNVLGSNGSVVPLFNKQIEEGGPVTVTHPDITRYFMTIPEACELVLEAGFMGKGGEIFVFDMGSPVKIADLANNMIRLSGFEPGKDIEILYTGLRPGEKLYEELLSDKETTIATHHPKILKAKVAIVDSMAVITKVDDLLKNLYYLSDPEVIGHIQDLVPEYLSANGQINNGLNGFIQSEEKILKRI